MGGWRISFRHPPDAWKGSKRVSETSVSRDDHSTGRPIWIRVLAIIATVAAATHIAASFLWIGPYSEGARSLFPGGQSGLSAYMLPIFGQSWSVFAPEPINGDYSLSVRAVTEENGQTRATEWVNATEVETRMLTHNLLPPRAAIQSTELAARFAGAWQELSDDHRVIVELGYYSGEDWQPRLREKLLSYGGEEVVERYLAREDQATRYATQVARAVWGDAVVTVQFEVKRQNVIPFDKRNEPDAVRPAPSHYSTGWRGQLVDTEQSSKDFSDVFAPLYLQWSESDRGQR